MNKLGETIYKSGLSKIDAKMVEKGGAPLSQMLIEHGAPVGTTKGIAEKLQTMATGASQERSALYQKATDAGVTVDMGHPLEKAESYISDLMSDKRASVRAQGEALNEYLKNDYKVNGKVDLATLSKWKTDLYNTLPTNFFGPNGKMTAVAKQFNAALASDFKLAIEKAGNAVEKGMGDRIEKINDMWGTLLDAKKPVAAQIKQAAGAPGVGSIAAGVAAAGHPGAALAMEGVRLGKTTIAKTATGKGLMMAAPAAGTYLRQHAPGTLGAVMSGNSGVSAIQGEQQ